MTITVSFEGYEKEDGTNRTMLMFEELNTGRRYAVPMACKNFRFPRDIPEYTILQLEGYFYWNKAVSAGPFSLKTMRQRRGPTKTTLRILYFSSELKVWGLLRQEP